MDNLITKFEHVNLETTEFNEILNFYLKELSTSYWRIFYKSGDEFTLNRIKVDPETRNRLLEMCCKDDLKNLLISRIQKEFPDLYIEDELILQLVNELFLFLLDPY